MSEYIEFELNGVKFRGKHLDPFKSLDTFATISPCLGEVLGKIDPKLANADNVDKLELMAKLLHSALGTFRELPAVAPVFLEAYDFYLERNGDAKWVPLKEFTDDAFKGKTGLFVAWLIASIKAEYFDFLLGSGSSILGDLGKIFGFRIASKDTGPAGK